MLMKDVSGRIKEEKVEWKHTDPAMPIQRMTTGCFLPSAAGGLVLEGPASDVAAADMLLL